MWQKEKQASIWMLAFFVDDGQKPRADELIENLFEIGTNQRHGLVNGVVDAFVVGIRVDGDH